MISPRYRRWMPALPAILLLAGLTACGGVVGAFFGPPPGEGPKAARGYAASAPIIAALADFHADHQTYPLQLNDLVPRYVAAIPQPEEMPELIYRKTETSYRLEFQYVGPGMNRCVYTQETGWDCEGYY